MGSEGTNHEVAAHCLLELRHSLHGLLPCNTTMLQDLLDDERVGAPMVLDCVDVGVDAKDGLEAVGEGLLVQMVGPFPYAPH